MFHGRISSQFAYLNLQFDLQQSARSGLASVLPRSHRFPLSYTATVHLGWHTTSDENVQREHDAGPFLVRDDRRWWHSQEEDAEGHSQLLRM
jgi:hypothetical protein